MNNISQNQDKSYDLFTRILKLAEKQTEKDDQPGDNSLTPGFIRYYQLPG
jgi:hypothetical protein